LGPSVTSKLDTPAGAPAVGLTGVALTATLAETVADTITGSTELTTTLVESGNEIATGGLPALTVNGINGVIPLTTVAEGIAGLTA
jgi:hypothetical protein